MFNRFLYRMFGGFSRETAADTPPLQEAALPCIGRKSDLVPVNAEIGRIVSSRSNPLDTFEKIAFQVRDILQYDRIAITILDFEQGHFEMHWSWGRRSTASSKGALSLWLILSYLK